MTVLDTSSLIRFFTNDTPSKATKVKHLLESKERLYIPDVVFPELEYVLFGKTYNTNRSKILKAFQFLIAKQNIKTTSQAKTGILIYSKTTLDIADCIILAYSSNQKLFSFDKQMLSLQKKQAN